MGAIGTAAALRARLRRKVGHAEDTALISDDLLDDCLADALRQINKHWPTVGVSYFPTIADQQSYTGILPDGAKRLLRVWWRGTINCPFVSAEFESELLDSLQAGDPLGSAARFSTAPSVILALRRERAIIQRLFEATARITDINACLLDPIPAVADINVYFAFEADRFLAPEDVTDDIPELASAFLAFALAELHETLSAGRGAISSVTGPQGVAVRNDAAAGHRAAAARAREEFYANLPAVITPDTWP